MPSCAARPLVDAVRSGNGYCAIIGFSEEVVLETVTPGPFRKALPPPATPPQSSATRGHTCILAAHLLLHAHVTSVLR